MKTIEQKENFIQLRAKGFSYDKISEQLQVSKPTLLKWNAEMLEEVKEQEFLEHDNLLNEFQVHRQKRFENNCRLLNACYKELESRTEQKQLSKLSVPELEKLVDSIESKLAKETFNSAIHVETPNRHSFRHSELLEL